MIAIIALSVGLIAMSLPDGESARLEEEGARLTALLEMARAESRVSGATVRWVPGADTPEAGAEPATGDFHFVGMAVAMQMPTRWLDRRTTVEVVGAHALLLGPEAILPPQRVVLRLGERRLELASDGLGPFAPAEAPAEAPAAVQ